MDFLSWSILWKLCCFITCAETHEKLTLFISTWTKSIVKVINSCYWIDHFIAQVKFGDYMELILGELRIAGNTSACVEGIQMTLVLWDGLSWEVQSNHMWLNLLWEGTAIPNRSYLWYIYKHIFYRYIFIRTAPFYPLKEWDWEKFLWLNFGSYMQEFWGWGLLLDLMFYFFL